MAFYPKNVSDLDHLLETEKVAQRSLGREEDRLIQTVLASSVAVPSEFVGLTEREIRNKFDAYRLEIEYASSLVLLAAIEAILRQDFINNRRKKGKFRKLYSQKNNFVRLEELIHEWRLVAIHDAIPNLKRLMDEFGDALQLRNWLAHGRTWDVVTNRKYSPTLIHKLGSDIAFCLSAN